MPAVSGRNQGNEFRDGWPVVLAAGLGLATTLTPLLFYTLGLFIGPLQESFDWKRQDISLAFLTITLASSIGALFAGGLADRFGSRTVALLSMVLYPVCFIAMSQMSGDVQTFILLCGIAAVLGVGTTAVVFTRTITTWFSKQRGLALGITLTGTGITATFAPLYVAFFLERFGWQAAFQALSALPWLIGLPIVLWGLREHAGDAETGPSTLPSRHAGFRLTQALGQKSLYVVSVAVGCVAFVVGALIPHLPAMLVDSGLGTAEAARIAALVGVSVIAGRLVVGYLVDYFFAPHVAAICLSLPAISALLLLTTDTSSAGLVAIGIGFASGAEFDLVAYLISRYFGVRSYSAIYAIPYAVVMTAAGFGPVVVGRIYDLQGSYHLGLQICVVVGAAGALAFLFLGPYPRFDNHGDS